MRARTLLVMLLAVVCGISAATGVVMLRNQQQSGQTVPVVVCQRDVARGQIVSAHMVARQQWPRQLVPAQAVTDLSAVVGRTALTQIMAGEPVLSRRLANRDAGRGLAALIPQGRRAYTIQTSRVASNVAGFVMPGNRVDVLLTLRGGSDDATGGGSSTTLLQAVEILAVDQRLEAPAENRVEPQQLRSVTLLVTPDQASLLDLGQNLGTLTLSLRNLEDIAQAETVPATVNRLRYTQRKPVVDGESLGPTSLMGQIMKWAGAAAVVIPKAASLGSLDQEADQRESDFVEIQTLRGRHFGRVLARPNRK